MTDHWSCARPSCLGRLQMREHVDARHLPVVVPGRGRVLPARCRRPVRPVLRVEHRPHPVVPEGNRGQVLQEHRLQLRHHGLVGLRVARRCLVQLLREVPRLLALEPLVVHRRLVVQDRQLEDVLVVRPRRVRVLPVVGQDQVVPCMPAVVDQRSVVRVARGDLDPDGLRALRDDLDRRHPVRPSVRALDRERDVRSVLVLDVPVAVRVLVAGGSEDRLRPRQVVREAELRDDLLVDPLVPDGKEPGRARLVRRDPGTPCRGSGSC